jgi:hypothetical protein
MAVLHQIRVRVVVSGQASIGVLGLYPTLSSLGTF